MTLVVNSVGRDKGISSSSSSEVKDSSSAEPFRSWCIAICTVTFDLEFGQAIEDIVHLDKQTDLLTEDDKSAICYLAFPDSNSCSIGDSQFHFNFKSSSPSVGVVFGFVYFRQVKDASVHRGYYQKSVVILTQHCLVTLYHQMTALVSRRYFSEGPSTLSMALDDVRLSWPTTVKSGTPTVLTLLEFQLELTLPSAMSAGLTPYSDEMVVERRRPVSSTLPTSTSQCISPPPPAPCATFDLFATLNTCLADLQAVWELILVGRPLMIFGPTPASCSQAVHCVTHLIHPIAYAGDARPYFTIHDPDYRQLSSCSSATLPSAVVGATNPFLVKSFQRWPHILQLGGEIVSRDFDPTSAYFGSIKGMAKRTSSNEFAMLDSNGLEHRAGLHSRSKPFLYAPKALIKKIVRGVHMRRPATVQSSLIKSYFFDLSHAFLLPLERYLATLMPLAKQVVPFHSQPPRLASFDVNSFLASLDKSGPQLTSKVKGDWAALYRQFFRSSNFTVWLQSRLTEMEDRLRIVQALSAARITQISDLDRKSEIELIDLLIRLRSHADTAVEAKNRTGYGSACRQGEFTDADMDRLQEHTDQVMALLPLDLRSIVDKPS